MKQLQARLSSEAQNELLSARLTGAGTHIGHDAIPASPVGTRQAPESDTGTHGKSLFWGGGKFIQGLTSLTNREEEEEEEEEESLFITNAVNEEDSERDRGG